MRNEPIEVTIKVTAVFEKLSVPLTGVLPIVGV